ncbi:hypothetical protein BFE06_14285 [Listeria monocytogenes]|nr:hypothetical protein [Listeria monocytogenes]
MSIWRITYINYMDNQKVTLIAAHTKDEARQKASTVVGVRKIINIEWHLKGDILVEKQRTKKELEQEIKARIDYFYFQLDGSYAIPNNVEGDLLKMTLDLVRMPDTEVEEVE